EAGLSIHDVKSIYLKPSDARAAFDQGNVDAWVIWDPYLAAVEHDADARILRDGQGLVDNHQFYLASQDFAKKYPQVLPVVVEQLDQIDQWAKANPQDVARALAPQIGV